MDLSSIETFRAVQSMLTFQLRHFLIPLGRPSLRVRCRPHTGHSRCRLLWREGPSAEDYWNWLVIKRVIGFLKMEISFVYGDQPLKCAENIWNPRCWLILKRRQTILQESLEAQIWYSVQTLRQKLRHCREVRNNDYINDLRNCPLLPLHVHSRSARSLLRHRPWWWITRGQVQGLRKFRTVVTLAKAAKTAENRNFWVTDFGNLVGLQMQYIEDSKCDSSRFITDNGDCAKEKSGEQH